jgi:hypothetical protein
MWEHIKKLFSIESINIDKFVENSLSEAVVLKN